MEDNPGTSNPTRAFPCYVCGSNQAHNICGVNCCADCALFFHESIMLRRVYTCSEQNGCVIESKPKNADNCEACWLKRCYNAGLTKQDIVDGEKYQERSPEWLRDLYLNAPQGHTPCRVCNHPNGTLKHGVIICADCVKVFETEEEAIYPSTCQFNNECPVDISFRNRCLACRYRKCVEAGCQSFYRVSVDFRLGADIMDKDPKCAVCGGFPVMDWFGVYGCGSCISFTRRSISEGKVYVCDQGEMRREKCELFPRWSWSKNCHRCLLDRCYEAGMNRDAVMRNEQYQNEPSARRTSLLRSPGR